MSNFLPFALPDITEAEINEVVKLLRAGWITTGPKVARFEQQFATFLGGEVQAVAVNSATAGLHLALAAIGIGPGDEVIVPVHTFTATAEIVCYLGAKPVFVDIDAESLTIDVAAVEAATTPQTKAIIPVHYAGLACSMNALIDLARRHRLKIVEDAAHALPTTYHGKLIGTLGTDATVFSFYANKTVTTGEGGMVSTYSEEVARAVRIMRLHGIDRDVHERFQGRGSRWYYQVVSLGYKYNLTDLAAAIGIHQMARAWPMQRRRAAIARVYDTELRGLPLQLPAQARERDIHAHHLYVVQLTDNAPMSRDEFIDAMHKRDIGCSVHYVPLHFHPFWQRTYALRGADFPVSTSANERLVSLPIYSKMTDADIRRVVDVVRDLLG